MQLSNTACHVTRIVILILHGLVQQPWGFRDTISQCSHVQCKWRIHPAEAS